jgi:hypothetical protein
MKKLAISVFLLSGLAFADTVTDTFTGQIGVIEGDVLTLAEKMPANKYSYSPVKSEVKGSDFAGVRTFGDQVRHLATVLYMVSQSALGDAKAPVDLGPDDSGPRSMTTKEAIVPYLKGALAYAKKAAASVNQKNMLDQVKDPFGTGKSTRLDAISIAAWHSMDHYGQMVVYARLNGVKPGK